MSATVTTVTDVNTSPISDRRPNNLDEAPELLTLAQAAHSMGMSIKNVRQLEANDPTFPSRRPIPFAKVTKFRRTELQRWFTTAFPQEIGA